MSFHQAIASQSDARPVAPMSRLSLYYYADTCALASHIMLLEAGLRPALISVDIQSKVMETGGDFRGVNPKGYVPALVLADGSKLTESVAILDWISQLTPEWQAADPMSRTKLVETLTFISTELQKPFVYSFTLPGQEAQDALRAVVTNRLEFVAQEMHAPYLLGDAFSAADAFLYVMLRWARMLEVPVSRTLVAYRDRIEARAAVQQALSEEGLQ